MNIIPMEGVLMYISVHVVVLCVPSPQSVCPVSRPVYKGCTEVLHAVNPFTEDTFGAVTGTPKLS